MILAILPFYEQFPFQRNLSENQPEFLAKSARENCSVCMPLFRITYFPQMSGPDPTEKSDALSPEVTAISRVASNPS